MRNRFDDKHFDAELPRRRRSPATGEGASLYGELFYHVDQPALQSRPERDGARSSRSAGTCRPATSRRSLGRASTSSSSARVEYIDPDIDVKKPANDSGARELDGANPTWGYIGFLFGRNLFWTTATPQAPGELRDPQRDQALPRGADRRKCTGAIKNNLFVAPAHRRASDWASNFDESMRTMRIEICSTLVAGCVAIALARAAVKTPRARRARRRAAGSGGSGHGGRAPGSGGGASIQSFTPNGCGFSIAPRPEYQAFAKAAPTAQSALAEHPPRAPRPRRQRRRSARRTRRSVDQHRARVADRRRHARQRRRLGHGSRPVEVGAARPHRAASPGSRRTASLERQGRRADARGLRLRPDARDDLLLPRRRRRRRAARSGATSYSFTTTPGGRRRHVKIGVTGDSRGEQNNAWQLLQQRVPWRGVTLQLFSGDMINLAPDQGEWEQWLDTAWKDADGNPSRSARCSRSRRTATTTTTRRSSSATSSCRRTPRLSRSTRELFYSVDVGPVAHRRLRRRLDRRSRPGDDPDYNGALDDWLDADLDAANAEPANVPWIVTMHHHPRVLVVDRTARTPTCSAGRASSCRSGTSTTSTSRRRARPRLRATKPLTGPADNPTIHTEPEGRHDLRASARARAPTRTARARSSFTELSHDFTGGGAIGLYGFLTVDATSLKLEAHELRADGSDPMFDTLTITK